MQYLTISFIILEVLAQIKTNNLLKGASTVEIFIIMLNRDKITQNNKSINTYRLH